MSDTAILPTFSGRVFVNEIPVQAANYHRCYFMLTSGHALDLTDARGNYTFCHFGGPGGQMIYNVEHHQN
jgi:hypothetical protein